MTLAPAPVRHVPLRRLHQHVRKAVGQRVDWLRIYVVNEEEILLAGASPSASIKQHVVDAVRKAAPSASLRSAIVVGELPPGLRVGMPERDRRPRR